MNIFKLAVLLGLTLIIGSSALAQTSTEFWFAPPEVTSGHVTDNPVLLRMATSAAAANVTIDMPANPTFNGGSPITLSIAANSSASQNMSAFLAQIETAPMDAVLNTGVRIVSDVPITVYYEVNTGFNPDIFALKGLTGLGTEFYTPFQDSYINGNYSPTPYTSFDIVATEDDTEIIIYPRVPLDGGHPALSSYTITLDAGQTYSGGVGTNTDPNPAGTAIASDKPVAVSVKDDSVWWQPEGCRDLIGDQLVPVDIMGTEYIVNQGSLNSDDLLVITATENVTQVSIGGVYQTTLFTGESFEYSIDQPLTFVETTKPVYAFHITGFGCEVGGALLPPLNCAGSEQVSFIRSNNEFFGVNLLVKTASIGDFELNGDPLLIPAGAFNPVPGTGGDWMGAQISFSTGQIPAGSTNLVTNSSDVFALGLINGGASSGCRFGYFSEFAAEIFINAGANANVCANETYALNGQVTGGATTGIWTSSGTGTFSPTDTDLNADYVPSAQDILNGNVTLTLTSTGQCEPVTDDFTLTLVPAPIVDAGADMVACANAADVMLSGTVQNVTGGIWSGGAGIFSDPTDLNAIYSPTAGEISSGTLTLTLTSTGNGICQPETDDVTITFGPAPTANAGTDISVCANNAAVQLGGSVTIAGGGQWSGGAGTFSPSSNNLNAAYNPTAAEIAAGSLLLTLTTTSNGGCNPETDDVLITFTTAPTANAGADFTVCENNADINLSGSVSIATGGQWTGGLGIYSPNASDLNAVYTPTAGEIVSGSVTLTLTTTGNGDCNPSSDDITVSFSPAPVVQAGADVSVCAANPTVNLTGIISVASGGVWTSGGSNFFPSATNLNAVYEPTPAEVNDGGTWIVLTSTGNGNCVPVSDSLFVTIDPVPVVEAGPTQSVCGNNATVQLNGQVWNAGGGTWSGGTGSFSPSAAFLDAQYAPSAAEIAAGVVNLTLSSTNNGQCSPITDQVQIDIFPAPIANAGADADICSNNALIQLNGSVQNASGGFWSGGTGVFAPSPSSLTGVYQPTAAEIASGSITLILTTGVAQAGCIAENDEVTFTFTPAPTVDAGGTATVCANAPEVALNGNVTVATGAVWSGGNGSFDDPTDLNATYTPTAQEITNGTVLLTLTSTGNGNCNAESDLLIISITDAPVVNAGSDVTTCVTNTQVDLGGSVSGPTTTGIWSSSGTGVFTPSNTALDASYIISAQDSLNGGAVLTLSSSSNGLCAIESDDITLTLIPAGKANAGPDQTLCSNNATAILLASVSGNATAGTWTTSGDGSFSNPSAFSSNYTPGTNDLANGSVFLTFTANSCDAHEDVMRLTFTPGPVANAGADVDICANNAVAQLAGSVSVASGGIWSGGNGTFNTTDTDLAASYTPSLAEVNAGSVTLTLTTTGNGTCLPAADQVTINISPAPTVNAGSDQTLCASEDQVVLNGSVSGVTSTGSWATNGTGVFSPNNFDLGATYILSSQDSLNGGVTLTLTSTNNDLCNPVSDDMSIFLTPAGFANAGPDQTSCANNASINVAGAVSGNATAGVWSTNGDGNFANANLANTNYTPGTNDLANGNVELTYTSNGCNAHEDNMTLSISPAPVANAGADIDVCANNAIASLNGSVSIAAGGVWSGGSGVFNPSANDLNATYTPTAAEINAGSVVLTLTTTGNGNCLAESDAVTLNITPAPVVNAGANLTACASDNEVALNGSVSGSATTGSWSTSGTGTFSPNNFDLGANYILSAQDSLNGGATLTLTSTGNGLCNAESDDVEVLLTPVGFAQAGADATVCANNALVSLSGNVTGNATAGSWSTSGDGSFANASALNTNYTPGPNDLTAGSVTLSLTSNGCNADVDQLLVTILEAPSAFAGADIEVCANNAVAQLAGAVSLASGGVWSGGNGTFTPSTIDLEAEYTPTQAEINLGQVTLTLTTTGNGSCLAGSDQVTIDITPAPSVNAGPDIFACASDEQLPLAGIVNGPTTTGSWTTTGTGAFSPSNFELDATYIMSAQDSLNGGVVLTLTSTNNGLCNSVSDDLEVFLTPVGFADAGADLSVCANNATIALSGTISGNATSAVWSTDGDGNLANPNSLNTNYSPGPGDIANGSVILFLTSNGCNDHVDQIVVTITPEPVVNAGVDIVACSNDLEIDLAGSVTGASNSGTWTSSGSGSFFPSDNVLNATYIASAADAAFGNVTLTLSATGTGNCNPVNDQLSITILPEATVDAGADAVFCSNNAEVTLNGSISGGGSDVLWTTSGTGTFSPSATTMDPTYLPSAADLISGGITLTLSATSSCNNAEDEVEIDFTPAPSVNAGSDQQLCESNPEVTLAGAINGGSATGIWSTNGTGSFLDINDLTTDYTPSIADVNTGQVTLTLTSTDNGDCLPVTDDIIIYFSDGIIANAGADQQVCIDAVSIQLDGAITNGSPTGIWTTSGTGTFNNETLLNAQYTFSDGDIADGIVQLTLTTTNTGDCDPDSDFMTVSFGENVFASAGEDATMCASEESFQLNGLVSGGSNSGFWTSSGSGTFNDPAINNAQYFPSDADIAAGNITLSFTSTNNGSCEAGEDSMVLSIFEEPTVQATQDFVICGDILEIDVEALFENAEGVNWTSLGTGSFTTPTDQAGVSYLPSEADSIIGQFELIVETFGSGNCDPSSASVMVQFGGGYNVDAGENFSVCASEPSVILSATSNGSDLNYTWTSNGTGTIADPNALNTTYNLGENESGEVQFVLSVQDNLGCQPVTDVVLLTIYEEAGIVAAEDASYCSSVTSIPLTATVNNTAVVNWTTTGTGIIEDAAMASTVYTPSQADAIIGTVTFTLSSDPDNICGVVEDSFTITLDNSVVADFSYTPACLGDPVIFTNETVITSGNVESVSWSFGEQGGSISESPEWIFPSPGVYDVTLFVEMLEGCTSSITQQIEVEEPPVADFSYNGVLLADRDIEFFDLTSGSVDWFWEFGLGGDIATTEDPIYEFNFAGDYEVTMIATNAFGCQDTAVQIISINPGDILPPKAPTGFSPNGDGQNDVFFVRGGPFTEMVFSVYNGWGEVIFQSTDAAVGWDGTHKGKNQPVGMYVYTIKALTAEGIEYEKAGKVTLIR